MVRKVTKNYVEHSGERFHERATRDAYELALQFMSELTRGHAFDLAAGSGYTSRRLKELGFDVTAFDIFIDQFVPTDIPIEKVDLNVGLRVPPGSADAILALEVIEHLENPKAFLRDVARALKPGGGLVLSTPNVVTLGSKLRFALREELELFFNEEHRTRDPFCEEAAGHISPLLPWLLDTFIKDAGLVVTQRAYTKKWGVRSKHLGRSTMLLARKPAGASSSVH